MYITSSDDSHPNKYNEDQSETEDHITRFHSFNKLISCFNKLVNLYNHHIVSFITITFTLFI